MATSAPTHVEVWRFIVGPSWHVRFEGTPEVIAPEQGGGQWVHHFEPRPGETLTVTATRPVAVEGPTFAFENVLHALTPGRRSTDTRLEIGYRSTQGGRHAIELPEGARLRQVMADGAPLVIRDQDGRARVAAAAGGASASRSSGRQTLESRLRRGLAPSSSARPRATSRRRSRCLRGAGCSRPPAAGSGPAVLYWAELAVFVALALLLGRLARSPARDARVAAGRTGSEHVLVGRAAPLRGLGVRLRVAPPVAGECPRRGCSTRLRSSSRS